MTGLTRQDMADHTPAAEAGATGAPVTTVANVALIIPARDEAENIPALMRSIPPRLFRCVILVDNGSTDATAELAHQAGATVLHEPQAGYGAACLRAVHWLAENREQESEPDVVAFIDADLADDPGLLPRICAPAIDGSADLVIGSRPRLAGPGALTPVQRLGNGLSCLLIRLLTGQRHSDLGPMRAIRWPTLVALRMADRTWGWTVEMQYKTAARGFRVQFVDVPYRPRRAGRSKISGTIAGSVRAGTRILLTIARLRWQERRRQKAAARQRTSRPHPQP